MRTLEKEGTKKWRPPLQNERDGKNVDSTIGEIGEKRED